MLQLSNECKAAVYHVTPESFLFDFPQDSVAVPLPFWISGVLSPELNVFD